MGMVMNRFDMFTQLRSDIKHGNNYGLNMNQFILTGVVVHDVDDSSLVNHLKQNFVRWAESTGKHFLLVTFVRPYNDWRRSQYCHEPYSLDSYNFMVDITSSKESVERTMPLLRDFMDLPKSGSFLVLTDNICSNTFNRVPISKQTIENQLLLITNYCEEEYAGRDHSPADFQNLLRELNAGEYSIMSSLLDVLIDYSSVSSSLHSMGFNDQQIRQANEVIENVKDKLHSYEGDDFVDRLFHLFECMEVVLKNNSPRRHRLLDENLWHMRSYGFDYLDEYSKKLYESYKFLSSIVENSFDDLDYSGLTIYLGKIVENEIHLSIVQMLRWAMGIDMPTYYNKYCQGKNVVFMSGDKTINLNQSISSNNTRLKGIPMGTILRAYEIMYSNPEGIEPEPIRERLRYLDEELLDFLWYFCSSCRNRASHLDNDSRRTYTKAKEAFENFLNRFVEQLYDIKTRMRGNRGEEPIRVTGGDSFICFHTE